MGCGKRFGLELASPVTFWKRVDRAPCKQSQRNDVYDDHDHVAGTSAQGGKGWRSDGYIQEATTSLSNRLHVVSSLRLIRRAVPSPGIASGFSFLCKCPRNQLQFGAGRYTSPVSGNPRLRSSLGTLRSGQRSASDGQTLFGRSGAAFWRKAHGSERCFFDREANVECGEPSHDCIPIFPPHGSLIPAQPLTRPCKSYSEQNRQSIWRVDWIHTPYAGRATVVCILMARFTGVSISRLWRTASHSECFFATYRVILGTCQRQVPVRLRFR